MTRFSPIHATKVLALAAALAVSGLTGAHAGDGRHHGGVHASRLDGAKHPFWQKKRHEPRKYGQRKHHRHHAARYHGRHWKKGDNFYGGAITAYRDPGNGIYFYIENDRRTGWMEGSTARARSGLRIIETGPANSGCSWEAGVCVVRP